MLVAGCDGSEASDDALALAALLARTANGSMILIATSHGTGTAVREDWRQRAFRVVGQGIERIQPAELDEVVLIRASLNEALLDVARRRASSIIVIGTPTRGDSEHSRREFERVLRGAPCPVAIAPAGYGTSAADVLERIGVAFDGWPESRAALAHAAALARGTAAALCVLMVGDPHTAASRAPADEDSALLGHLALARQYVRRAVAELPPELHASAIALSGPVSAALTAAAREERLDLLVLGSRGLGPVMRVMLGGVSSVLAKQPPCPLLIIPRGFEPPRQTVAKGHAGE